jgi:glutathionylspermidine synthase
MKRCTIAPRPEWRARVEQQGLVFHTTRDTGVYWGEGTFYELTTGETDAIASATRELHAMCLAAVRHVIDERRYRELGIGELSAALAEQSWREQAPSLYGRFDFALGDGVPKLLEYNADTPTSLLEAGVIQWTWREEVLPSADQFTLVHDRLIATWRALGARIGDQVHFACVDDLEDQMTTGYLRDTAEQAGLRTIGLAMEDIGWDRARGELVDLEGRVIRALFKLYPWEGLVLDDLAPVLPRVPARWLEPAWKMILSNKAILPILWQLFPDHPNLLPASREPLAGPWVRKPLLGREGSNVTIEAPGVAVATGGPYADRGFVYQAYAELGCHDGLRPVVGSWVIGGEPAGIGIRESDSYVTSNTARFVPHVVG